MLEEADPRRALRLSRAFGALVALTFGLIVLGALVRAHGAGLACPDWPLCFGEWVPTMDVRVAFEWSHRLVAGSLALGFAALAGLALRRPATRRGLARPLAVGAALLALQIVLGALTVWELLAAWTVTAHLVTGNAFCVTLVWTACSLREPSRSRPARAAPPPAARAALALSALLLLLQFVLGGLVSSRYAGLACPEWPACSDGTWFPAWSGVIGLHVWHRLNAYLLLAALAATAIASRRHPGLRTPTAAALVLALCQVVTGIANVLLGIPVEVTGLHSALAAALAIALAIAAHETTRAPRAAA